MWNFTPSQDNISLESQTQESATMFWGMTLEPGKLYTEVMGEEVQLSMAAIESRKDLGESPSTNFCQIVIQTEKGEYVLCTLVHGVMFQQSLDLKLMPREKVTFSVQGPSVVYLVGYTASYPEDEEEMRMQQEEYEEDSSAWDTFEEEERMTNQPLQQAQVQDADDSDTDVETDNKTDAPEQIPTAGAQIAADAQEQSATESQGQIAPSTQERTEGAATEETARESGDEMIFSVAEIDQSMVKTEPADQGSEVMPPSQEQLPPPEDIYGPLPGTSEEYFYPETQQQQQANAQLNAPMPFQSINSGLDSHQRIPSGGMVPLPETFLQSSNNKTPTQRPHVGPIRQSSPRQPAKRSYPSPRKQYGTNRSQPAGKTRPAPQQMRNAGNIPQQPQSLPGPSQMNLPGPSNSGPPTTTTTPPPGGTRTCTHCSQVKEGPYHLCTARQFVPEPTTVESCEKSPANFQCHYCDKSFSSKANCSRHLKVHSGFKVHVCNTCDRAFYRKDMLQRHVRSHIKKNSRGSTDKEGFHVCHFCNREFYRRDMYNRHLHRHLARMLPGTNSDVDATNGNDPDAGNEGQGGV